jgi:hypothetical protein
MDIMNCDRFTSCYLLIFLLFWKIQFAQFEMKIVLAKIMTTVDLALADNRPVKPIRRGLTSGVSPVSLVKNGEHFVTTSTVQLTSSLVELD